MPLVIFMKYSVLLVLLALAGCTAQPTVTSWLDPVSVATLTSQTEPVVLVRVTPSSRIQRSFVQLMAVEVNRMGARRLYLVMMPRISGTLTPDQVAALERSFGQVEIRADERSVTLDRYTGAVAELGIGQPELVPIAGSPHIYFPIEHADLRAMAAARQFELVALGLSSPRLYEEWSNGRRSLGDFVSQLPGAADSKQGDAP